jgi:hypothetical protein
MAQKKTQRKPPTGVQTEAHQIRAASTRVDHTLDQADVIQIHDHALIERPGSKRKSGEVGLEKKARVHNSPGQILFGGIIRGVHHFIAWEAKLLGDVKLRSGRAIQAASFVDENLHMPELLT